MTPRFKHTAWPAALALTGLALLALAGLAQAQAPTPTPLPLYALPNERTTRSYTSSTLALADEGRALVVANQLNGTVSIVEVVVANQARTLAEVPVGPDPRGLAVTPDGLTALVVLRGQSALAVLDVRQAAVTHVIPLGGALAYGVVANADTAYVSLQGSGEIAVVDLAARQVRERIPVPAGPTGLALWGEILYVTHFWSGDLSLVYLPQSRVIDVVATGADTGATQAVELDTTRGLAYLPQTRSNTQNRFPTFDTVVFPVVNVLDLRGLSPQFSRRLTLDTLDRPVNMPFAAALDRFRNWLYVANAGSNDVTVVDLNTGLLRANIPVGANPRAIVLNRDNTFAFVNNALDGTVTIINTNALAVVDVLPVSNLTVPVDILIGAQLFHSAADPRLSADRWQSCANCHFDGLPDGRTWAGFPGGPRNTPPLFNLVETAPYNWDASWDELADVELKIRRLQGGTGLVEGFPPALAAPLDTAHAGLSPDLDTLAAYLASLQPPPNPTQGDPAQIARGEQVFGEQGCAECHLGTAGSSPAANDVGTGGPFDTPQLRYLWLSAPFLHDGSAATLRDIFSLPGAHFLSLTVAPQDLEALVAYLLSR